MDDNELWNLFIKEYKRYYELARNAPPLTTPNSPFKDVWFHTTVDIHEQLFDLLETTIIDGGWDFVLICKHNIPRWDLFSEQMWSAICEWNPACIPLRVLYI